MNKKNVVPGQGALNWPSYPQFNSQRVLPEFASFRADILQNGTHWPRSILPVLAALLSAKSKTVGKQQTHLGGQPLHLHLYLWDFFIQSWCLHKREPTASSWSISGGFGTSGKGTPSAACSHLPANHLPGAGLSPCHSHRCHWHCFCWLRSLDFPSCLCLPHTFQNLQQTGKSSNQAITGLSNWQ